MEDILIQLQQAGCAVTIRTGTLSSWRVEVSHEGLGVYSSYYQRSMKGVLRQLEAALSEVRMAKAKGAM